MVIAADVVRATDRHESGQMEVLAGIPIHFDLVRKIAGVAVNLESMRDVRQCVQIRSDALHDGPGLSPLPISRMP